ncbi:four-carbon acid sugar kinase family protein [Amycolatopsis kentuckyensis]|uniref:four-carbon acid sugar kinase family protein n=1 Tax=Amycolatopsis kentuckyensis TaxID=218823 RepID=UPI000A3CBFDB|nr:four-carbon acid sugar kinase family protein [Amycolatopsis kentuckyensis]
MPKLLVLGDDLTGSNATGALYARFGLRAVSVNAPLAPDAPCLRAESGIDALVVNLSTRHVPPPHAAQAVREAIELVGPVRLTVKRVDTTLRGNVGAETEAVLASAPEARALVVPAFPDAGRVTLGGLHLVDGVPLAESPAARDPLAPVRSSRVRTLLQPTRRRIAELPLDVVEEGVDAVEAALRPPAGIVVCDATTNRHLTTVARAAARLAAEGTRWISVDSGPFGVRLAAALGLAPGHGTVPPVLAVVGSITGQTHDQLLETELVLDARYVDVDPERPDPAATAAGELLAAGHRVVGMRARAPAPGTPVDPEVAARLPPALGEAARLVLGTHRIGGLYATGGDIAVEVTKALGAEGFEIDAEVLPLAVAGRLSGGPHAGLPFATKGGLIGGRDAAVACLEHLNHVLATGRKNP